MGQGGAGGASQAGRLQPAAATAPHASHPGRQGAQAWRPTRHAAPPHLPLARVGAQHQVVQQLGPIARQVGRVLCRGGRGQKGGAGRAGMGQGALTKAACKHMLRDTRVQPTRGAACAAAAGPRAAGAQRWGPARNPQQPQRTQGGSLVESCSTKLSRLQSERRNCTAMPCSRLRRRELTQGRTRRACGRLAALGGGQATAGGGASIAPAMLAAGVTKEAPGTPAARLNRCTRSSRKRVDAASGLTNCLLPPSKCRACAAGGRAGEQTQIRRGEPQPPPTAFACILGAADRGGPSCRRA